MRWVADLIKSTILEDPSSTNKVLRKVVEAYGYPYAFTESILQDARKKAKLDLFGMAEDNAKYADGVVKELKLLGHHVELLYSSRAKVVSKLGVLLIAEENRNRKQKGEAPLEPNKRSDFVAKWRFKNAIELENQIGMKDGNERLLQKQPSYHSTVTQSAYSSGCR